MNQTVTFVDPFNNQEIDVEISKGPDKLLRYRGDVFVLEDDEESWMVWLPVDNRLTQEECAKANGIYPYQTQWASSTKSSIIIVMARTIEELIEEINYYRKMLETAYRAYPSKFGFESFWADGDRLEKQQDQGRSS